MKKRANKKGFTLAELLIVVAIIAVLVAVAIPVFTTQLEKAKDATDKANVRAAYAEYTIKLLENSSTAASDYFKSSAVKINDVNVSLTAAGAKVETTDTSVTYTSTYDSTGITLTWRKPT